MKHRQIVKEICKELRAARKQYNLYRGHMLEAKANKMHQTFKWAQGIVWQYSEAIQAYRTSLKIVLSNKIERPKRNPWVDKYFTVDTTVDVSVGVYADNEEAAIKKATDLIYKLEGEKTVEFLGDKDLDFINFPDTNIDNEACAAEEEYRICDICGERMVDGYCYGDGMKYYCSEECLHHDFTDEEWEKECEEDETSYWTQWY